MFVNADHVPSMAVATGWWLHESGWSSLRSVSPDAEALWHLLVEACLDRLDQNPAADVDDDVLATVELRLSIGSIGTLVDELVDARLLSPAKQAIPSSPPLLGGRWVPSPVGVLELVGSPTDVLQRFLDEHGLDPSVVELLHLEVRRESDGWLYRTGGMS
jgi:hypothetical protein